MGDDHPSSPCPSLSSTADQRNSIQTYWFETDKEQEMKIEQKVIDSMESKRIKGSYFVEREL